MRVVVTGASGNIGTALLRLLGGDTAQEPGAPEWAVTGIARRRPDIHREPYGRATWIRCDLGVPGADRSLVKVFDGADAVVHLAWAVQPSRDEAAAYRTDVAGSEAVLAAARAAGVPRLVALSSVAAYGLAPRTERVSEDWPRLGMPSAYGRHKRAFEELLDGLERDAPSMTVTRLRPAAVLQRDAGAELIRWTLGPLAPARLIGSRLLPVPLWPGIRLQCVHADDVAEAIRLSLLSDRGGAFNLAAEPVLDGHALASLLGGFRVPVPLRVLSALAWAGWRTGLQPLHPSWLAVADQVPMVDSSRAASALGWRPRHDGTATFRSLVEGIRRPTDAGSAPLSDRALAAVRPGRPQSQSQHPTDPTATRPEAR